MLTNSADSYAFVGYPMDVGIGHVVGPRFAENSHYMAIFHLRHAAVMQSDDLPIFIERRRPRGAGEGIGSVFEKKIGISWSDEQFVIPHTILFGSTVRILDNADGLSHQDFARRGNQRETTELLQGSGLATTGRGQRDDGKVEFQVRVEELLCVESENWPGS